MKKKTKRGPAEWKRLNILGCEVSIYRWPCGDGKIMFNAYAVIPDSQFLDSLALGNPTFRDGDEVGVDTAHKFNDTQPEGEKLMCALNEIEKIIMKAGAILDWKL